MTANMNISEKCCLFVQVFETKDTRELYYSAVKDKIQPEDDHQRSIKAMLYFFPFFFSPLKCYFFLLKQTQLGRRKMVSTCRIKDS